MDKIELIKKLASTPGISGFEKEIREVMKSELKDLAPFQTDNMGSISFEFKGNGDRPKIIFIAHMDEAGFMVKEFLEGGFIKFQCVGGWDPNNMFSSPVEIINSKNERIPGFLAAGPTSMQKNPPKKPPVENLVIDIGAISKQDAIENYGIQIGDPIAITGICHYNEKSRRMLYKSFDDRAGVAAVVELGKKISAMEHPNTVYCVGSAQEAVGIRGARAIAQYTDADICFVVEGAPADDLPGVSDNPQTLIGQGAHIRIFDPSLIVKKELKDFVIKTANDDNIKIQVAIRKSGATDGSEIQFANQGVPSIVLAVPARGYDRHSCRGALISLDDFDELVKLLVKIVEKLDQNALEKIKG